MNLRRTLKDLVYPEEAVCRACGAAVQSGCLCNRCREALRCTDTAFAWDWLDTDGVRVYSLRPHTGLARDLVIRLKHHAEACLAEELAALADPPPVFWTLPPETLVTWVTMPPARLRERCIDHGRLLAGAVARRLGLSARQLLNRRAGPLRTQASLGRAERAKNLTGAFAPVCPIHCPVLLVDDVRTTGATVRSCAEALRSAGAPEVTALTITAALLR